MIWWFNFHQGRKWQILLKGKWHHTYLETEFEIHSLWEPLRGYQLAGAHYVDLESIATEHDWQYKSNHKNKYNKYCLWQHAMGQKTGWAKKQANMKICKLAQAAQHSTWVNHLEYNALASRICCANLAKGTRLWTWNVLIPSNVTERLLAFYVQHQSEQCPSQAEHTMEHCIFLRSLVGWAIIELQCSSAEQSQSSQCTSHNILQWHLESHRQAHFNYHQQSNREGSNSLAG